MWTDRKRSSRIWPEQIAREDGFQRKRKREGARENGTEASESKGGRDWNEAKFRITGLGAPVKLTGGGGQNGVAKRKVVGKTEVRSPEASDPVFLQDLLSSRHFPFSALE